MKTFIKNLQRSSYIFVNNRLYIRDFNKDFIRVKQKLPEFIDDINELKKYDIEYIYANL